MVLAKGTIFHGRYEVVRRLRAGGMGAIYEVIHLETRRRRALKLMLPSIVSNLDMHARFKLEATVAADIDSEHIVETFDAGVDDETGVPFLVMELLRGEDLAVILQKRRKLPPGEVLLLLSQTASALDKTHAAGVVHRDLKPENLFVTRRDDGTPKLKILDFGIAKVIAESGQPAAKTKAIGTPFYMSPEQFLGDGAIGPRADLYALGHIAFALLVGTPYWEVEGQDHPIYALMMKIVAGGRMAATERATAYGGTLPPAFDMWFSKATHVVPEGRFGDAAELVEALAAALDVAVPRVSLTGIEAAPISDTLPRIALGPFAGLPAKPNRANATTLALAEGAAPAGATPVTVPSERMPVADEPAPSSRAVTQAPAVMAVEPSPMTRKPDARLAGALIAAAIVVAGIWLASRSAAGPTMPPATVTSATAAPPTAAAMAPATSAESPTITPSGVSAVPPLVTSVPTVTPSAPSIRAAGTATAKPVVRPPLGSPTVSPAIPSKRTLD